MCVVRLKESQGLEYMHRMHMSYGEAEQAEEEGPSVPHIPSIADALNHPSLHLRAFDVKWDQCFGSTTEEQRGCGDAGRGTG